MWTNMCCLISVLMCTLFSKVHSVERIPVDTDLGRINGIVLKVKLRDTDVRLKAFLGIPYALPPTGKNRFRKPEAVGKFEGEFDASEIGAACMQPPTPSFREFTKMSEDCLFLNIYVPDQVADKSTGHAVMVFIHGGGFHHGAGETYPGNSLASIGNVIVVTLNYRLNLFGFLSSGDEVFPGNVGLWDQHMALQWINKHISAFGGDNNRVTVFGESAGASSVLYQAVLPQNKDLIQRVISQSGAPSLRITLNTKPREQFFFLAKQFGCLVTSSVETYNCMTNMDARLIMETIKNIAEELSKQKTPDISQVMALLFFPVVDGDFIKTSPADLSARSKTELLEPVEFYRSLDVMIGHNSQEGGLMMYSSLLYPIPDMDTFMPSREDLTKGLIDAVMVHEFGFIPVPDVIKSLFISEFTDWSSPNSPESVREQYVDMMGNVAFEKATIEFIRMHSITTSSSKSYAYVFDAVPSTRLLPTPKWASGSNHADELGFVFGFAAKLLEDFKQIPTSPKAWEWDLSEKVQIAWSNFAKTGNPNEPIPVFPWPQYDMDHQHCLHIKQGESESKPFCNSRRANFLLDIIPEVMSALQDHHHMTPSIVQNGRDTCNTADDCNKT